MTASSHIRIKTLLLSICLTVFSVLLITPSLVSAADPLDNWHWRNPLPPQSNELVSVNYVNNLFIAVGEFGTIFTSPDGQAWTRRNAGGSTSHLTSVSHGNGLYVVVGGGGEVLTSPDGITWASRSSGTTNSFKDVTFGNGRFVAVAFEGTIHTSGNGINWIQRASVINNLEAVTYGNILDRKAI